MSLVYDSKRNGHLSLNEKQQESLRWFLHAAQAMFKNVIENRL
jgi:hypothetical protein